VGAFEGRHHPTDHAFIGTEDHDHVREWHFASPLAVRGHEVDLTPQEEHVGVTSGVRPPVRW
jgi:hypothetical protein